MEAHAQGRIDAVVHCGPVAIGVTAELPPLRDRALAELEQFTSRWDDPCALIRVHLRATDECADMGDGRYLRCSRMHVDRAPTGLVATCASGASGIYDAAHRQWDLRIRAASGTGDAPDDVDTEDNVEDLLELVLTTAWREAGWIPLHAGAVVHAGRCALLAAPAKGGKSTLTTAMLHRGWRTLGDDKALIAMRDGQPEVRGLNGHFNLDPRTCSWFAELGDLQSLPRLSRWSAKRRVAIEDIWGDRFAERAAPTHLVLLRRFPERRPPRVERLSAREVLSGLLHQTVVPADPPAAKAILTVLAGAARSLRGIRFEIGDDAYADPRTLDALEAMLA